MPQPAALARQRSPDHRHRVGPPQQAAHRQQHMRHPAVRAPRPPRPQRPADPVLPPDHPGTGVSPPRQPAAHPGQRNRPPASRRSTTRASPSTVTIGASAHLARPSRHLGQEKDGRAAANLNVITVAPHTKKDNPPGCPQLILTVNDARRPLRPHRERRRTPGAASAVRLTSPAFAIRSKTRSSGVKSARRAPLVRARSAMRVKSWRARDRSCSSSGAPGLTDHLSLVCHRVLLSLGGSKWPKMRPVRDPMRNLALDKANCKCIISRRAPERPGVASGPADSSSTDEEF